MLCREIVAICSEVYTKHINICEQNTEFLSQTVDCIQSN